MPTIRLGILLFEPSFDVVETAAPVDNWLAYSRGLGATRSWIVASLDLVGIKPEDIPPEIVF